MRTGPWNKVQSIKHSRQFMSVGGGGIQTHCSKNATIQKPIDDVASCRVSSNYDLQLSVTARRVASSESITSRYHNARLTHLASSPVYLIAWKKETLYTS